jgi:TolB-like protein
VEKGVPERTNVPTERSRAPTVATLWYRGRNTVIAIPPLVIVIAATVLYLFLRPQGVHESARALPATSTATPPTPSPTVTPVEAAPSESRTSVAVLPFANLAGDATKQYFGDGMAEELIDALAHIPGLKVPARISSFAYKGRYTDIKKIAQALGVGSILEGSVDVRQPFAL